MMHGVLALMSKNMESSVLSNSVPTSEARMISLTATQASFNESFEFLPRCHCMSSNSVVATWDPFH